MPTKRKPIKETKTLYRAKRKAASQSVVKPAETAVAADAQMERKPRTLEEEFGRIDKTAFSVSSSFEEADADDKAYWLSRTPHERLRHLEYLRRMNYGHRATARLQRVLEITSRS